MKMDIINPVLFHFLFLFHSFSYLQKIRERDKNGRRDLPLVFVEFSIYVEYV
jgi:hypothetical protein